ncbi:MAG TPA: DUF1501 domain-containing protein [Hyphomonadaceae bacterium]|nr:DUF1501 domain-containing protein [Hyphomonadaceae bacterium]HPI48020.1 DUF1501 domain-containing protein [Hyphomonadaceae bacterium]
MIQLNRRSLLLAGCAATLVSIAPGARANTNPAQGRKLIVVILRGAMDGVAALPKLDDPDIRAHRAALIDVKATPLSNGFALHSAMPTLAAMYASKEAAFVPALAGPYRERSHFEAQDLLECGEVAKVSADGWLNRALQRAPAAYSAVSIGPSQPLILRGASPNTSSWSPAVLPEASGDTLARLLDLYENDPVLKPALSSALGADSVAGAIKMDSMGGGRGGPAQYVAQLQAAGNFLAQPDGPEIAVVSLEGWDTHTQQNQMLQQRFTALDNGIRALKASLGETWKKTALVAVSEFGRTVRVNGGGGTDHGTGGLAILAGGAIKGGRMIGDWPGLKPAALFENRDLMPAVDARQVFKGLLRDQLGWAQNDLDTSVFHDSANAKALTGLV